MREGGIGLLLTTMMVLIFLGSLRATVAILLLHSTFRHDRFLIFYTANRSIDSMVLSGLALAFSRLIDDSVVVLENIYRHIEHRRRSGNRREESGANEVALAVLAITLIAVVVFFPVTLLFGVSKFLFTALALAVVIALFASYFVAVTVVPLLLRALSEAIHAHGEGAKFLGNEIPSRDSMQNSTDCWIFTSVGCVRRSNIPEGTADAFAVIFLL